MNIFTSMSRRFCYNSIFFLLYLSLKYIQNHNRRLAARIYSSYSKHKKSFVKLSFSGQMKKDSFLFRQHKLLQQNFLQFDIMLCHLLTLHFTDSHQIVLSVLKTCFFHNRPIALSQIKAHTCILK